MYQIDFSTPIKVHFIGIGGISMSGLAVILAQNGFSVSGSDARLSSVTDALARKGIRIFEGNAASNLSVNPDVVIYTAAVHPDNPEYVQAMQLGIPMLTRAELLGQIMKNYPISIGVSGTHGKTTSTSMLTHVLLKAELHPTVSVGGMLDKIGGNIHVEDGDIFLAEACEYTNSFLSLHPTMELILNIEEDHLDFFKDLEDIRNSFALYMRLLPPEGSLIINGDIPDYQELTDGLNCRVITVGKDPAKNDFSAVNLSVNEMGCYRFDAVSRESDIPLPITLSVVGIHNVYNALAVIAAAKTLGVSDAVIQQALQEFTGTDRRFQKKGSFQGVTVIDDYAHHPHEIEATLTAAKDYPHQKLWVVFQPHTYTRTKALFNGFVQALSLADEVVLAEIYPARETDTLGMHSALLQDAIAQQGTPAHFFPTFQEIENFLKKNCINGDLLITMGAGDVVQIGEDLLSEKTE